MLYDYYGMCTFAVLFFIPQVVTLPTFSQFQFILERVVDSFGKGEEEEAGVVVCVARILWMAVEK